MNILEKDIEDILFEYIDDKELMEVHGLERLEEKYYRQVNLGSYGVADIIGVTLRRLTDKRHLSITIYELKRDEINIETLLQASKYVKAINRIFNKKNREVLNIFQVSVKIVLIGRKIETNSDFVFLCDFIDDLYLYTYSLDFINGLKFELQNGFYKNYETEIDFSGYLKDIVEGQWHGKKAN